MLSGKASTASCTAPAAATNCTDSHFQADFQSGTSFMSRGPFLHAPQRGLGGAAPDQPLQHLAIVEYPGSETGRHQTVATLIELLEQSAAGESFLAFIEDKTYQRRKLIICHWHFDQNGNRPLCLH